MSDSKSVERLMADFGLDITCPTQFRSHLTFLRWLVDTATMEQWMAGVRLHHLNRAAAVGQPASTTHLIRRAVVPRAASNARRSGDRDTYTISRDHLNAVLHCCLAHIFHRQDELAALINQLKEPA